LAFVVWVTSSIGEPRHDEHDDGGAMKFLLIHYFDENDLDFSAEPDEDDPLERELHAWLVEMNSAGIELHGGRLRPASEAVTLQVRAGERLLSDGPFAETKEQIAGFDVLQCDSLADAIEVASRHPSARLGTFELRQFWE
jgi:hypothetical protein